jgi:CubicO group peptidase (beta-lactamase class C family)
MRRPDFSAAHAVLRRHHDERRLSGASALIFRGGEVVDEFCIGEADIEQRQPMRPDHIHRAHSNTKLITAVMTLMLADEGRLALDDPIKQWIPGFGATRVLRPGATSLDDTEALARDVTVRHLLTHTAGLSHGVFDPGTMIYEAYGSSGVRRPDCSATMIAARLPALPLLFQPGKAGSTRWPMTYWRGWWRSSQASATSRHCSSASSAPWAWSTRDTSCGPSRCHDWRRCMAAMSPTPTSQDSRASMNCRGPAHI